MSPCLTRLSPAFGPVAVLMVTVLMVTGCGESQTLSDAEPPSQAASAVLPASSAQTSAGVRSTEPVSSPPTPVERSLIAPDLLVLVDGAVDAVRASPLSPAAWLALGLLYDANAMGRLAVTAYERAVELAPDDHRPAYHLARVLERTGQAERAIHILRALVEWAPAHAPAHGRLGSWMLEAGDLAGARSAFERCAALDPEGLEGSLGLARVAIASTDAARAVALLEPLRDRHPDIGEVRFLLGSAYRLQGRLDEARIELAAWDGQPAPRFDAWEADVAQRTAGYQALMDQAVDWGRRGEAERALEPLERLHRSDPDDSAVLEKLVAVYIDTKRFDDARRVLGNALQRDATHYRSWRSLSLVEEAAGDLDAARSAARRCLALHPTWVPGHELSARLRWRAGDLPGAVEALESALRFGGAKASSLGKLARAQAILLRWDDARQTLESALMLAPESAEVHALAAEAWAESGGLSRARELLAAAARLDAEDEQLRRVSLRVAQLDPQGAGR